MKGEADSPSPQTWLDVATHRARLEIIVVLAGLRGAIATELTSRVNASAPTVRRQLEILVAMGVVREHAGVGDGITPGRPPACFSLAPEAADGAAQLLKLLATPIGVSPRRTPGPPRPR